MGKTGQPFFLSPPFSRLALTPENGNREKAQSGKEKHLTSFVCLPSLTLQESGQNKLLEEGKRKKKTS